MHFDLYSKYYDLLYQDKNYSGEVDFILKSLGENIGENLNILEVGCGTGGHAALIAESGHNIHGIDISESMIGMALKKQKELPEEIASKLTFEKLPVADVDENQKYDVVLALFHVVSYFNSNEEVLSLFRKAKSLLKLGGLFLFDYWYGPAVLTEKPEERVKTVEGNGLVVTRHATPEMHIEKNVVDVNYDVNIREVESGQEKNLKEKHPMRFFFTPEVKLFLEASGFEYLDSGEWMSDKRPSEKSWGVYTLAKS